MNGLGYHPEPVPGFIPLLVVCFILGSILTIHIPAPAPQPECRWYHYPTGWDSMKHWRECHDPNRS